MRLTLDVIWDSLPENYRVRRYGPASRESSFARPLFYDGGMPLEDDTLYVARAEALPEGAPPRSAAVVCVGARVPQEWRAGGVQLLLVQDSPGVLAVFNDIQKLFNRMDAWDGELRDELERDEDFDIRRVLAAGARGLGRSIGVSDHVLRTIFQVELCGDPKGKTVVQVEDNPRHMSVKLSEQIKEITRLERDIQVPYFSSYSYENGRVYCNNLYPMGSFSGCVFIHEDDKPFRESDIFLMNHFLACFRKAFWKYLQSCGQVESPAQRTLHRLLDHAPGDQEEALVLGPGEAWVCFQLREDRSSRPFIREYMAAMLNGALPDTAFATVHHGVILGLIRLGNGPEGDPMTLFEEALRRMGYVGGVSNPFTDLDHLGDYMQQAGYAVENGRDSGKTLCYFQDHALSYILDVCTREMPADALVPRGLTALLEHDRQRGTEYVHTLDVYLQNETHTTQTAGALYIHRSSLIKRLDKIQQLLGEDDLTDPDTRLLYRICLALLP